MKLVTSFDLDEIRQTLMWIRENADELFFVT